MNSWLPLLIGWIAMALAMAALWFVQRVTRKAGIVDVAWALGIGLLSIFFALTGSGTAARRWLIAVLPFLWGFRLAFYLFRRLARGKEDGRYERLKRDWGNRASLYLFLFFQIQAVWSVLFAFPMWVASRNQGPIGFADGIGIGFWILAVVGESIADRQLARFRSDSSRAGQVCRDGLWRYSRHPNYFFEWLHWWAYVFLGWGAPLGWLTLAGPALMLLFLFKITGIPPTEARALESRGDAYREYQKTTSPFIPWPPKQPPKD